MKTLTIVDEDFTGKVLREIEISVTAEQTTVRDLIVARVNAEVDAFNSRSDDFFRGLVQPTGAEQTLNGYKLKERRKIDAEKQAYIALDAFQKNGYFVLIDNMQAESLEQEVLVSDTTTVSFLKLTPLVGG